jgi:hypothetical protein
VPGPGRAGLGGGTATGRTPRGRVARARAARATVAVTRAARRIGHGRAGPACHRIVRYYRNPVFRPFFHSLPGDWDWRGRHTRVGSGEVASAVTELHCFATSPTGRPRGYAQSVSPILTVNARGGIGLTAARSYFKMTPAQFRSYIGSHHVTLRAELASHGVSYDALGPALVPSTTRHEIALLFNIDLVGSGFYGYAAREATNSSPRTRVNVECSRRRHRTGPRSHT